TVQIHSSMALFDRIFEYLDMPLEIQDAPDATPLPPETVNGEIRLRDVSFRYDPEDEEQPAQAEAATPNGNGSAAPDGNGASAPDGAPVPIPVEYREWALQDIDVQIEPGQLAALVGPSGAGKTTVTYLIPRLYDVTSGAVEIDGHDVRHVTLESLGDSIGMVTQETYLFHDTVRANLLYGKPDATDE